MLKYKLVKKVNPLKRQDPPKWYATPVTGEPQTTKAMTRAATENTTTAPIEMEAAIDLFGRYAIQQLQAGNSEIYAWITVPGTEVDHPVCQSRSDDEYYLRHRASDRQWSSAGAIFTQSMNALDFNDPVTVIYGHNWLDTTMFSQLVKYSDFDFYKEHPVIEFNTRYEMHKWKIFAVFITTATASEDNGYVFNFVYPHMGGVNYEGYMAELQKRSLYDTGVDVNENDKFLTLSTCTREVDTDDYRADCRIVIVARMVRDGESASVDTSAATENVNPKYPQIWYDKYGLVNPYKDDALWYPKENDPEQASSTTNEAA